MDLSKLSEDLSPTEMFIERVLIMEGPDLYSATEKELDKAKKEYGWMNTPITIQPTKHNFNKLTWGQFVDLNKFTSVKNPVSNLSKIVAVIEGYDDFALKCEQVEDEIVIKPYNLMLEFLKHRDKVAVNYDDLFSDTDDEPDEEESQPQKIEDRVANRWAWESVTFNLAKGDITKVTNILSMSHLMVLNWLTMVKDLKLNQQS
jgi:hypothetical protein